MKVKRPILIIVVVALVATLVTVAPAGAHTERQLHAALKALRATNAAQARQIRNLRARMAVQEFESNVCFEFVSGVSQFALDFNFDTVPDDTALDFDASQTPQMWVQEVAPVCVSGAAARPGRVTKKMRESAPRVAAKPGKEK